MNSAFFNWTHAVVIALAGGVIGIALRIAFHGLFSWLDVRLMPMRYLKKCGVRRREADSVLKRLQQNA